MHKLAVTSKNKQTDAKTVLISHMSDPFLKKFDNSEKKFQLLVYAKHIQCIKYKHIQNLTKQSPV